jgi:hypothetical protein
MEPRRAEDTHTGSMGLKMEPWRVCMRDVVAVCITLMRSRIQIQMKVRKSDPDPHQRSKVGSASATLLEA